MNHDVVAEALAGVDPVVLDFTMELPVVTSENLYECLVLFDQVMKIKDEFCPFSPPEWVEEWVGSAGDPERSVNRWFIKSKIELRKEISSVLELRDHHVPAVFTYEGEDYSLRVGRDAAFFFLASELMIIPVFGLASRIGEVLKATPERPERETALALELFNTYFASDASVRNWIEGLGWVGTLAAFHHPELKSFANNVLLRVPRGGTSVTLGVPHRDIAMPVEVRGVPEPWGWGGHWNCVGDSRVSEYLPVPTFTGEPEEDFAFVDVTFDAVELLVWYRQQLRPVDVEYLAKYNKAIHNLMGWTYDVYEGEDFPYSAIPFDPVLPASYAVNRKELLDEPGPIPSHVNQKDLHEYIRQHARHPVFVEAEELGRYEFEFLNQWLHQTLTRNMVVAMRYLITNAHFNVTKRVEYVERAGELAKTPDLEHLAKALIQVLSNW